MADVGLWTIAKSTPDQLAVIDPDGKTATYGELAAAADRIGRGLAALGLKKGDCVAGLLPNSTEALALTFAALETGLYVVPMNWHLTGSEVAYILNDSGAAAFVAHERFAGNAVVAADEAGIKPDARFAVGHITGFEPLTSLDDGTTSRPDPRTAGALMVYTSGTSGRPKGVRRPLTGQDPDEVPPATPWFFGLFGLKPFGNHVHLCCSPLYHTAVLNFATISLQLGHPVVLMDRFEPEEMLRLIHTHHVTHTHMVPTQFRRLLALPEQTRERYDTTSLRAAIHGAAPCPHEVKRRMLDWWGPVVIEYYAASEGGGTGITAQEWLARPGSVGKAWPGAEIRILDKDGNEVPAGETGLVYMRMGNSTFDYYKDEAKTLASRARGMFTVGDIGYLDEDGYLYLCDRGSDMIISGGVNIYPAEIESELACHPAVADVAVFGIPHDDWGEEIKAVVEPAAGAEPGPELTADLLRFLAGRIAKFKLPRSIDYVAELPRDPNGKLYKRRLRDPYWAGRERAILFTPERRLAFLGERARPFLRIRAGENAHADLRLDGERVVFRHAFGLPDRPQDRAHGERPVRSDHVRCLQGRGQRRAIRHHPSDQPERQRLRRRDVPPGEQQVAGQRVRDLPRQPHRRPAQREQPPARLRHAEPRALAGHPDVARLQDLGPARDSRPLHGRDQRLGQPPPLEQRLDHR
jgi:long-chain acyl-CoA synthetase